MFGVQVDFAALDTHLARIFDYSRAHSLVTLVDQDPRYLVERRGTVNERYHDYIRDRRHGELQYQTSSSTYISTERERDSKLRISWNE